MKKSSILFGAIMLAIGGTLAKIIGAFYKIPLTNILGSNGIGVYYLIFPIYSLFIVVSSSGISIALSKCIAISKIRKNKQNENMYLRASIILSFVVSLLFSIFMLIFAKSIAYVQGNINAYIGYIALAPALIVSSLISVMKGYFQGIENMLPSSITLIVEQVVKLFVGLFFATKFLSYGIEFAVLGAVIGVTISELVALITILSYYLYYKTRVQYKFYVTRQEYKNLRPNLKTIYTYSKAKIEYSWVSFVNTKISFKTAMIQIFKMSIPNMLIAVIMPLTSLIDSFIIVNILVRAGFSTAVATSLYGINNGAVGAVISLPIIITMAIATIIVPNLSGLIEEHKGIEISKRSTFFIKLTWIISLLFFVLFVSLSPNLIGFLYNRGLTGKVIDEYSFAYKLLTIGSITIIYNALLQTFTSILQCLNKSIVPFIALSVSLVVRTLLMIGLILIPAINIFGVVIANVIFLSLASIICIIYIKKYIQLDFSFYRMIICPLFSAVVSFTFMFLIKKITCSLSGMVNILIVGMVGLITYVSLIFLLKTFNKLELKYFPLKARKITKLIK